MDREFWNKSYQDDPGGVEIPDLFLEKELSKLTPGKALDLGCGTGRNALKIASHGWSVVGIDWAETAIKIATKRAQELELEANFIVGDITNWDPIDQFDLVICTFSLPGGTDSLNVLQTGKKAMADRGAMIVIEWDKSMAKKWEFQEDDLHTPQEIAEMLPGLYIEIAEVRQMANPFGSGENSTIPVSAPANVVFVLARRV